MQVAPSMRMFTIRVSAAQDGIETWKRGDFLTLRDPHQDPDYRLVAGQFFKAGHAQAIVLSVEEVSGGYELSLLSDPSDAPEILMAEAEGRLKLEHAGTAQVAKTPVRKRCHIRQRHGEGVISVEIPCQD